MRVLFTLALLFIAFLTHAQNFEIYVSDAGNFNKPPWQILKFDEDGKNPEVFINTHLNWPQDILFLEASNEVLISNLGSGCIHRHNATTGEFIENFACSIKGPTRIKIGADNLLYVLQWSGNGKVLRYKLDGSFVDEFTSVGVSQSIGLDWDDNGNLYVSSYNGDLVRKFDEDGDDMGVFINSNLAGPTNIWFDSNGDLLVADYDGNAVKRFDSDGKYQGNFISGLSNCEGVAFFPNGNILIGNGKTSSVRLYKSDGTYLKDLVQGGAGNLLTPNAVVLRTIDATGSHEVNLQRPIFSSTIGSTFHISENYSNTIERLSIYNSSGKLVDEIDFVGNRLDAGHLPEGFYLITIQLTDGSMAREKVIVNKQP